MLVIDITVYLTRCNILRTVELFSPPLKSPSDIVGERRRPEMKQIDSQKKLWVFLVVSGLEKIVAFLCVFCIEIRSAKL